MSQTDCFTTIIGLSRSACECFEDNRPADYLSSDSDLFIDELDFLNLKMVDAASDCSQGNLWELLDKSREEAVKHFKTDLLSCIRSKARLKRDTFKGFVGDANKMSADVTLGNTYHGMRWYMANVVGGYIKIKRIGAAFNQTTSIALKLYNNQEEDWLNNIVIQTEANKLKWNTLDSPLILTLKPEGPANLQYLWLYQPSAGLKARNVKISCNCGSGYHPSWNINSPSFSSSVNKGGYGWADWMMAMGTRANDISLNKRDSFMVFNETQGLAFEIELGCNTETVLCDEEFNYTDNPFAKVMAYAIRFKAGVFLLNKILSSGNPSRYTLLDGEMFGKAKEEYAREYAMRVDWLCEEMSKPENINMQSDCFTCNDLWGYVKGGIFS